VQYKDKVGIQGLLDAFRARFGEFETEQDNVILFTNLFIFPGDKICTLEPNLQQEVIDVKCSSVLKSKFMEIPASQNSKDMIQFWRMLPAEKFPHFDGGKTAKTINYRNTCIKHTLKRLEKFLDAYNSLDNHHHSPLCD